jgi:hypothetical protein
MRKNKPISHTALVMIGSTTANLSDSTNRPELMIP